ncbi:VanZ like family protein [Microbacterium sp. ru370.1]|uniref:VanZ family protein n=1 Tax=unclassified Microbacterium TaxID=2609290 RepID=UPI000882D726|nr:MULTISPECIES: VanZ family protein [unclassified Microbacterium]SDO61771.1 VanZ like family protein [Microbacterium sp. ru370.1]SIT86494.1 VanZ like family protein [Microbacterium sp. RU1D]
MTERSAPLLTPARVLSATGILAVIAALTLAPRAIAGPARALALGVLDRLPSPWTDVLFGGGTDVALNIGFFIPLGAAVALLLPLRWAPASVLMGAAVSATVEIAQTVIPGRVPDSGDVVANTAGALIGTVVVVVARLLARR